MHAKLQRRDDGWYVVDLNSTNGTYVGGSRVSGQRRLEGAPDVRFGGVKLRFLSAGVTPDEASMNAARDEERKRPQSATAAAAADATPSAGTSWLLWVLLALVIAVAVLFLLRGRA